MLSAAKVSEAKVSEAKVSEAKVSEAKVSVLRGLGEQGLLWVVDCCYLPLVD